MPNALIRETSPYLLQHAHNPVEWLPWGEGALSMARRLDRPIFLSIGYSACHWCHVMAHESFEDGDIAEMMNENFVNIKVDREERPDIDDVYQRACQKATGQGGWPLSAFLTPEMRPFYIGTYFAPLDSHGRPGFGSVCRRMAQIWREDPGNVGRSAQKFADGLQTGAAQDPREPGKEMLDEAAVNLVQIADPIYGGFGQAPKFPGAGCISFLLRYSHIYGMARPRQVALSALDRMARGGIFDHIAGGFHRYSTDRAWLVPHFEKMLYDNALLPAVYAEAYLATGDSAYMDISTRTLDFVLREMRDEAGGFYSAYDADSEEGEGIYHTWTKHEIRDILGDEADLFCTYYGVVEGGNWEGRNILHIPMGMADAASRCGIAGPEASQKIAACRDMLLEARLLRPAPGLDSKILASWNALAVSALVSCSRAGGNPSYMDAAESCIRFIRDKMQKDGLLLHSYAAGRASIPGFLEDHAYLANALLDVFEAGADPKYLERALELGRTITSEFWDGDTFHMTSKHHERLFTIPHSMHDLSAPSGGSAAMLALSRLHRLAHAPELGDVAAKAMAARAPDASSNPFAFGHTLCAITSHVADPGEILILNTENTELCQSIYSRYVPGAAIIPINDGARLAELGRYPLFAGKRLGDNTEIIACTGSACSAPMHTTQELDSRFPRS